MCQTGNKTTIAWTSGGYTLRVESIVIGNRTLEALDDSTLETSSFMAKCPADLADAGTVTVVARFDSNAASRPLPDGSVDTVTITFPTESGFSDGATLVGTAFTTAAGGVDSIANNTIMNTTIEITWDGATPPAYTPGTPV